MIIKNDLTCHGLFLEKKNTYVGIRTRAARVTTVELQRKLLCTAGKIRNYTSSVKGGSPLIDKDNKIMSFLYVQIQVTSNNLEPERHFLSSHFQKIFEFQNCKFGIL